MLPGSSRRSWAASARAWSRSPLLSSVRIFSARSRGDKPGVGSKWGVGGGGGGPGGATTGGDAEGAAGVGAVEAHA